MSSDMKKSNLFNKKSFWHKLEKVKKYPALENNITVDAAVIGGGITGIMTAYHLNKSGIKTALLEAYELGHGTTGTTTSHLTEISDTNFKDLIKNFGSETVKLVSKSLRESITVIENLIHEYGIDCDYRKVPAYYYAEKDENEEIKNEFEDAIRGGLSPQLLNKISLPFPVSKAILYPNQAHFHILKFLYKMAEVISRNGTYIFENSRVIDVSGSSPYEIKTEKGKISAKHVVYATHTPLHIHITQMEMKVNRSYVIAAKLEKQVIEDALYWDNENPYHYFNLMESDEGTLIMIGGGDHHQGFEGNEQNNFNALISWAQQKFNIGDILYGWSGQEFNPPDGLPFIGLSPFSDSKYIATGFSGNGLAFGAAAADIISSLIVNGQSRYEKIYSPSRLNLSGIKDILELNAHVIKHIVKDRFDDKIVTDIENISAGDGGIIKIDNKLIAAYKDEQGKIHKFSPVCHHAQCIVRWNQYERTWDCPCHGSRFYPSGEIFEGPVLKSLERYDD
jgi:glycine/D-amino acid oxidase-like deaminating enzyme/nitrite reductase/ring-hydroxylating ferredoxin subunit